jgi:Fe-S cluster biogenesis protein NfuA
MSWFKDFLASVKPDSAVVARGDAARIAEVQLVLDELRPMIAADGGQVSLVAVEDGWVEVRLQGACTNCSSSNTTLQDAIEPMLRNKLSWVRGVRAL